MTMFKVSKKRRNHPRFCTHDDRDTRNWWRRFFCKEPKDILFTHGYGQDPVVLIKGGVGILTQTNDIPNLLKIVEKDYNMWLCGPRGTQYSQGHSDPVNFNIGTQAYWNWTFEQQGLEDLPAYIDKVYESNGNKKVILMNQSNGTTAANVALASPLEETFFEERVRKVIQLASCSVTDPTAFTGGFFITADIISSLIVAGLNFIGGPDFDTIYGPFFDAYCFNADPFTQDICDALENPSNIQAPVSTLAMLQYTQNFEKDTFQELIDPLAWLGGQTTSTEYNLALTDKVTIDYWHHKNDDRCPWDAMLDVYDEVNTNKELTPWFLPGQGTTPIDGWHQFVSGGFSGVDILDDLWLIRILIDLATN